MTTDTDNLGWWSEELLDDDPPQTSFADWSDVPPEPVETTPVNGEERTHPARLALGLAALAADRLGRGAQSGGAFVTGVGLIAQTASEARGFARRLIGPPARIASRTAGWASALPGAEAPKRSLSRSRALVRRVITDARARGEHAVAAGRADASAFVQARVTEGMTWAQAQAVPQIVDGLVPHLVDKVMPRLIDGAMPEIRSKVMPAVIEDLTNDPRVRDLMLEQGRGVVGEAAQHLRSTTATADDRVESAFRRLVRSPSVTDEPTPTEAPPPLGHG
jgi:hypothetical protein